MKKAIRELFIKNGIYYPLKYSRLFQLYEVLFKPSVLKQKKKELEFYGSFLPACDIIFDIGANDGHKTEAFLKFAGKVICCEPDSKNRKILEIRFRNKKGKVVIENKALSDKEGNAEFYIHHPGSAFNTLSRKWTKLLEDDNMEKWNEQIEFTKKQTVETTTLDQLVAKYGLPGFIKIDVEGFEEFVLRGLSHRVAYLSFETLLPDYQNELHKCLAMIETLGGSSLYNLALNEKLVLTDFVDRIGLENWFHSNKNAGSFEVIVKMSA